MSNNPIVPIYKYGGLRDLLSELPKNERANTRDHLCKLLDIHDNTLRNWEKIRFNSNQEIKSIYLEKIAAFFKVEILQLKSHLVVAQ